MMMLLFLGFECESRQELFHSHWYRELGDEDVDWTIQILTIPALSFLSLNEMSLDDGCTEKTC